jgi:hypothetical protein
LVELQISPDAHEGRGPAPVHGLELEQPLQVVARRGVNRIASLRGYFHGGHRAMSNGELVAGVRLPDAASNLYGGTVLGRSMLKFENVAKPPTALTGFVPESKANGVPVSGVMLTVIAPIKSVAVFPNASWAVTTTGGAMIVLALALLG